MRRSLWTQMGPYFNRLVRLSTAESVLLLFAFSYLAIAQQPKVLAPHKPIMAKVSKPFPLPPAVPGSMVGGPWMVDASFKSSIYLKNVVETSAVTVTPILYLSNGAKYPLPDVQLEASGTAIIDLNAALQNLGIAPYATLSGYVEIDYSWPWDPICATIRNLDTVHSLIFNYGFHSTKPTQIPNRPMPAPGLQVAEGMWWKQEPNVTGFVSLANTTPQPLSVSVAVSDGFGVVLGNYNITVSPHGTKMVDMGELTTATGTEGGIRVKYSGNSTDLLISGGLEDLTVGYSAIVPFASPFTSQTNANVTIAELGLMTGPADPMMQFPSGVIFTPYTIARNISSASLSATPTVWWMSGGSAQSVQLPAINLAPYHSQTLDLPGMLAAAGLKNYIGNINLVFDVQGISGGLLLAGGSVDQNNTYVFEITPHAVAESASKSLSYWSTANGDDTMVTVWNATDEAQDLLFRITFSGGEYELPVHLNARATNSFNISEVILSQLPDAHGNVIPLSIQEGGAKIVGNVADNQHILVVMDAGTYNVKKATCGLFCQTCDGVASWNVAANPFAVAVNAQTQQTFYSHWDTGAQYDHTSNSTWSTSNSGIATVGTGLVSGVSVGQVTISAGTNFTEPAYTNICEGSTYSCPVYYTGGSGSAPGNVTVSVTFSGTPVVPSNGSAPITATVTPANNTATITLTLATTSGSGSALFFPNGSSTMTITHTTSITLMGGQASSTPNNISLTATVGSTVVGSTTVTVGSTNGGAVPVNFMQTSVTVLSTAYLQFTYTWGSSSGVMSDVSQCQVREFVTYPGYVQGQQLSYNWTSPPYTQSSTPNPTTGEQGPASGASLTDIQGNVGFAKPYTANTVTSNQVYQFQCPYYQNNQWVQFFPQSGTIPIQRKVYQSDSSWQYTISKSGATATGNLP